MASVDIGRNDPCPCGSGKKYKQCHIGQRIGEDGAPAKADMRLPLLLSVVALIIAVAVMVLKDPGSGAIVAIVEAMGIGGYVVLRKHPDRDPNSKDPGGINFGR